MEKLSDILTELIEESGKSLRMVGIESGVPHSQISRYLKGVIPSIDVCARLSNFFNCSLDFLFGFSNKKGSSIKTYAISKFLPRYQEALNKNKITHWKFAHKYNFSESCIRAWKKGVAPKMEIVLIIAENLSVSVDWIVGKN